MARSNASCDGVTHEPAIVASYSLADLMQPDVLRFNPSVPTQTYRDEFGDCYARILAPAGALLITSDAIIRSPPRPGSRDARNGAAAHEKLA